MTRQLQTTTNETNERRFVCVVTEKHISVYQQPSLKVYASVEPVPEDTYVVRADTMVIEGEDYGQVSFSALSPMGFNLADLPRY